MAMNLNVAVAVHERRIRLIFTDAVGAAGFTASSPPYFTFGCENGLGPNPALVARFVVPGAPTVMECQLDTDLVSGGVYSFIAEGVENVSGLDQSGTEQVFLTFGQGTTVAVQGAVTESDRLLYGIDLQYEGADFVEGPDGDLAHTSGPALVRRDLWHRTLSDGLPWEASYGVHARGWIDGAPGAVYTLRGRTADQMLEDDRVRDVEVKVTQDDESSEATVDIRPTLIGDAAVSSVQPITQSFSAT